MFRPRTLVAPLPGNLKLMRCTGSIENCHAAQSDRAALGTPDEAHIRKEGPRSPIGSETGVYAAQGPIGLK